MNSVTHGRTFKYRMSFTEIDTKQMKKREILRLIFYQLPWPVDLTETSSGRKRQPSLKEKVPRSLISGVQSHSYTIRTDIPPTPPTTILVVSFDPSRPNESSVRTDPRPLGNFLYRQTSVYTDLVELEIPVPTKVPVDHDNFDYSSSSIWFNLIH